MVYDLILQNNATKREYLFKGLVDKGNRLAHRFLDFDMPLDAPYGEYTGYLVYDGRSDVEYDFKDVVLESVVSTAVGSVRLRDLKPEVFLLKYVGGETEQEYRERDTRYYYYERN